MECPDPAPQAQQEDRDHPAGLHLQDTHHLQDLQDPQASRTGPVALPTPATSLAEIELTALGIKDLDHHLEKEAGREEDLLEGMREEVEEILEEEEGLRPAGRER